MGVARVRHSRRATFAARHSRHAAVTAKKPAYTLQIDRIEWLTIAGESLREGTGAYS
jgi:hypothetical protein